MARIRTVKPEFWEDEVTTSLTRDARLLFIATFNNADDEGLLRWSPEKLKAAAFMYDDDIGIPDVSRLMSELVAAKLIHPYQGKASHLAWIVNFHRHQRINRPQASRLPAPSLQNGAVASTYATRDAWICHLCDGPVNQVPFYTLDPYDPKGPMDTSSLNASLDHVLPKSKGGTDYPSNIRLAHVGCNKGRRNRPVEDFSVPASVSRSLAYLLTSGDAEEVIVLAPFTEDAVNAHDEFTDVLPPEREREQGRGTGEGEQRKAIALRAGDDFDAFWNAYGKKVGKGAAEKAFTKARTTTKPAVLIAAATKHADWHRRADTEARFIPHASTWLNEQRWADERAEPSRAKSRDPKQASTNDMFDAAMQRAIERERNPK